MGGMTRMIENHRAQGVATGDPDADALLRKDGNAVLIGVLLDQQVRAEMAFAGPHKLKQRLGHLDVTRIASMDQEELASIFGKKPAVHRFYNMMAGRVLTLAEYLTETFGGDGAQLWNDGAAEDTVKDRAQALPGFGEAKVNTLPEALKLFGHRTFR